MRPGRAEDLPAIVELWRADVAAGRRDSMPRRAHVDLLADRFDWPARSRVVPGSEDELAGAVLASAYPSPDGPLAQLEISAKSPAVMEDLARWGVGLSRAAGAVAVLVWTGRGHGEPLRSVGLQPTRPWWRMDRDLQDGVPERQAVDGYRLIDGRDAARGSWADMHNRSFADHWRFSYRAEDELVGGKSPALCLMAMSAGGEPAAITLCEVERLDSDSRPQPVGLIRSVGTVPQHRRRGLATWLVSEALVRLRAAGARHASLYVDALNPTHAPNAYRKLGFDVAFESEVWEATFP